MHTVVTVQRYARCLFFPPKKQSTAIKHSAESQTTSISFPIRALRIVSATPPLKKVRDIGHGAHPESRDVPSMDGRSLELQHLCSEGTPCVLPAHEFLGWKLPSCLDLGLRQSAPNFTVQVLFQRLDWSTADPKAGQKYHEVVVPRHWSTLSPKTSSWRLDGTFQRW
jgi:hypothetical protein